MKLLVLIFTFLPCGLYFIFTFSAHFLPSPSQESGSQQDPGSGGMYHYVLKMAYLLRLPAGRTSVLVNVVEYEKGNYISLGDLLTAMTTSYLYIIIIGDDFQVLHSPPASFNSHHI